MARGILSQEQANEINRDAKLVSEDEPILFAGSPAPRFAASVRLGTPDDADAIAALHAENWRSAYRGLVPDDDLGEGLGAERLQFWRTRFAAPDPYRRVVFLAMSLMSLQLWTIVDLAGPILTILAAQTVLAVVYALFVIFRFMGRDYDAAVVCSGFAGISLGATPTAMANMTAVAKKYGQAHRAFIIVPLVSGFFVDIANAIIISRFLVWFG